jgi:hypothetical protein
MTRQRSLKESFAGGIVLDITFVHGNPIECGRSQNVDMGWWWSNRSSNEAVVLKELYSQNPLPASEQEQPSSELATTPDLLDAQAPKGRLTREEESDRELISWLKEIQAEVAEKETSTSKSQSFKSSSRPPPEDISPDSLYPTEISCRSAFDYAFFCQSFGGQFVNIYRYGTFRSCSNHWQDFWLCMRTRNWDDKDRKKAIQDHYRQKSIKYKTGSSSEDVWEVRTEPARDAFQGNLEELERQIEEWKQANPTAKASWEKSM